MGLELPPGGVQLVITRGQGGVQRLLVAELSGKGGVLSLSAHAFHSD